MTKREIFTTQAFEVLLGERQPGESVFADNILELDEAKGIITFFDDSIDANNPVKVAEICVKIYKPKTELHSSNNS